MAKKIFSVLPARHQSSVISQIHKLINYYSSIFPCRERNYLKKLSQTDGNIYWLEDDQKNVLSVVIIDPNYIFTLDGHKILPVGHIISKKPGSIEGLLKHIFSDYSDCNLMFIAKEFIAQSIDYTKYNLKQFNPIQLLDNLPEIANISTNYFNVSNEKFVEALARKENSVFFKFTDTILSQLANRIPYLDDNSGK